MHLISEISLPHFLKIINKKRDTKVRFAKNLRGTREILIITGKICPRAIHVNHVTFYFFIFLNFKNVEILFLVLGTQMLTSSTTTTAIVLVVDWQLLSNAEHHCVVTIASHLLCSSLRWIECISVSIFSPHPLSSVFWSPLRQSSRKEEKAQQYYDNRQRHHHHKKQKQKQQRWAVIINAATTTVITAIKAVTIQGLLHLVYLFYWVF